MTKLNAAIQNLRLGLRPDWFQKLAKYLNFDVLNPILASQKISEYQHDKNLSGSGFIDAPTRLALVNDCPSLGIRLIGTNTQERLILEDAQTEAGQYLRLTEILGNLEHLVMDMPWGMQILAIRGAKQTLRGWFQTDSASNFLTQNFGAREHFSSAKIGYADSMIALMWQENRERHVRLFKGCVSPNGVWPNGTAHLCDGQYFFRIGRHRTRDKDHMDAVFEKSLTWPESWVYDRTPDSVQYLALEGTSPIEIVRSHGEFLDISREDVDLAERAIAERWLNYVDTQTIKINIHTCALNHASSLGCQNILPGEYLEFMEIICRISELQRAEYGYCLDIPYSLTDASFV